MFTVHVDGSCLGNPGPGGYAAIIVSPDGIARQIVGSDPATTNNRMESMAAIVALEAIPGRQEVTIRSDSQILIKGMNDWIDGWKERGWRNSNGKPVENQDLWRRLNALNLRHRVTWVWIRGHNGDPMNELADRLAKEAAAGARVEAV